MFSWFRKKPAGPPPPGPDEVAALLAEVLARRDIVADNEGESLRLPGSGLVLRPKLAHMAAGPRGQLQAVTTIETRHPEVIPAGVFEYQHSFGEDPRAALAWGFDQWAQVDLVTLLDAIEPKPESCTFLEMKFPGDDGGPERVRRAILGPVAHMRADPPAAETEAEDEHPFCPCCLLTNSFAAFREVLEGDAFAGIRLFAARDEKGVPQADCRVNGEDWEPGARALRDYARTWPAAGYEFRKQYVALRTMPGE